MLYLCVIWTLIALSSVCLSSILAGSKLLPRSVDGDPVSLLFIHLWIGLALLGLLTLVVVAIGPVRPYIGLACLLVPIASLLHPTVRNHVRSLLGAMGKSRGYVAGLLTLGAAWFAAQQITYFDTAYYHLQLSRLLAEFGVIPGIVAVHPNLGQSSIWFAMVAPTLIGGEFGFGASTLNGYICALAAIQGQVSLFRLSQSRGSPADCIAGFGFSFILFWALRWGMIASASPDLPVMFIAVVAAWLFCLRTTPSVTSMGAAVTLCGFAMAVKLSAAPLLAVTGLALLWTYKTTVLRAAPFAVLASIVVLGTAGILGERASGCFAYPVSFSCLDHPWTPTHSELQYHRDLIASAARGGGRTLPEATPLADAMLTWAGRDKSGAFLVGLSVVFALSSIALMINRRNVLPLNFRWIAALAGLGTIFVLMSAPTGRFMIGYTAIWGGLLLALLPEKWKETFFEKRNATIVGFATITITIASTVSAPHQHVRSMIADRVENGIYPDPGSGLVLPKRLIPFDIHRPELPKLRTLEVISNGHVSMSAPAGTGECWAAAPPCTPSGFHDDVRYLDPTEGTTGGFYRAR